MITFGSTARKQVQHLAQCTQETVADIIVIGITVIIFVIVVVSLHTPPKRLGSHDAESADKTLNLKPQA